MAAGSLQVPTTGTVTGLTMANDMNTALAALAGANQGAAAPTPAGTGLAATAGMLWHDTGSNLVKLRDQADATWMSWAFVDEASKAVTPSVPFGQCRLSVAGATSLVLKPFQGNRVAFAGGQAALLPAAGVAVVNTGLAASTLYYAYLFLSSGAPTLELATTAHATDANTGIEIKGGDATRSLVGMAYTTASAQFADSPSQRFCLNWFNRRALSFSAANITASTTSSSLAPLAGAWETLCWADESLDFTLCGNMNASGGAGNCVIYIGLDSNPIGQGTSGTSVNPGSVVTFSLRYSGPTSEGAHNLGAFGETQSGLTANYTYAGFGIVRG